MRGRRLDRLFARFRSRGDARALAKLFDSTAPELYRVATHLAKDLHAAEDLVQSTFLAAIEARESWDESREVMPWLIGILARQAAYERRRRSRTIESERLERQSVPEPAEAAEAQELSAELERSIDGIPALYREVLIAHLKQGKTPQEIARDLGRAPGTVRVQLHRGLEMVRKTLPAGLVTGGMIAALSPRGLSAVRAAVVRSAASISVPTAAVPSTAIALGGWVVSTKAVIAVSGLVVGLLFAGRLVLHPTVSTRAEEIAEEPAALAPPQFGTALIEELARAPSTRTPIDTRAPAVPRRDGPAWVIGQFLAPDGSPASDCSVALVRMHEGNPTESAQEQHTDRDGWFAFEGRPGTYLVVGLRGACLPLVRQATLTGGSDLDLAPATFRLGERIGGHVLILGVPAPRDCEVRARQSLNGDNHGLTLAGEELYWNAGALRVGSRSARTDDLGRFVIEGLEPGMHEVDLERTPEQKVLQARVDASAPADDVALDVEASRLILRVRVDGLPTESHIALHEGGYGGSVWGFGQTKDLDLLVPEGASYVVDIDKAGYASEHFDVHIPSTGETVEKQVDLDRAVDGAELAIELVAPHGMKIGTAGFGLFGTHSAPPSRYRPRDYRSSQGRVPDVVRRVEASEGRFRLQNLPPDRYRVEVIANRTWDRPSTFLYCDPIEVELGPKASEQRRVEVRTGGRIRLRCKDRNGRALPATCRLTDSRGADLPLGFFEEDDKGSTWTSDGSLNTSAPNGANESIPALPPGTYFLHLSVDGFREADRTILVEAGKFTELSVVLDEN